MNKVLLFFALAVTLGLATSPVSALMPEKHAEYLKNEDYQAAFEQFRMGLDEARERLTPDDFKALEKANDEVIGASVKEDMASGSSEADAFETAYYMRYEQISRELRWDWLRKNAADAQGFYRLKSDTFSGYLTLEKGDEKGEYAVNIHVEMKKEPERGGDFDGLGKLSGGKMAVSDGEDPEVITITFEGETAKLTSSKAFKESGVMEAGVTIDGEYLRERK